jgi:hypothetical protein
MNEDPAPLSSPPDPGFKDRRKALMAFGILEIVFGALATLMILLVVIGGIMAAQAAPGAMPLRRVLPSVLFYALAGAALVAAGIGSCEARRWGRALSLIIAWIWLLIGLVTAAFMIFFLPSILKGSQQQGQGMPEAILTMIMLVSLGVVLVMFVAAPGILVCFFQGRHVKATCEAVNPEPCWTDACPLPVLGLSLCLGFGAFSMLLVPLSANGVLPVFGRILSGPLGGVCCVALAILLGAVAWGIYRLRPTSWRLAVGLICLGTASAFITFSQIDLPSLYRLMGYPRQQVELMSQYPFMQGHRMAYLSLVGGAVMLAYLLFVRRFFRRNDPASAEEGRQAG